MVVVGRPSAFWLTMFREFWLALSRRQPRYPQGVEQRQKGYTMPLVVGLGLAMMMMGLTAAMVIQVDHNIAGQRRQNGVSLAVAEGAADRLMLQLTARGNAILLGRNYDPVNPSTGKAYLGKDGVPNSGDETATALDEWTGYNPSNEPCFQQNDIGTPNLTLSDNLGTEGRYRLLAYRYNPDQQQGMLLVEGQYRNQIAYIALTITIRPEQGTFPGIVGMNPNVGTPDDPLWDTGVVGLRGRVILGSNANVYYVPEHSPQPSLIGNSVSGSGNSSSGPGNRAGYLNAIFASVGQDGASPGSDPVGGNIFACRLTMLLPAFSPQPGTIINSSSTLTGTTGTITRYWISEINLDGNETLTVDTTAGPVYIHLPGVGGAGNQNAILLQGDAKILNVRSDGKLPRVGDLRILTEGQNLITLKDRSCIQTAFIWSTNDELRLLTSGAGCPSGRNTNFEGVAWMEAVLSSKNAASNRDICYLTFCGMPYDTTVTPGATSGIYVPEDVSSLTDVLRYANIPVRYRVIGITSWQQVRL
jgi:hypothetical protein